MTKVTDKNPTDVIHSRRFLGLTSAASIGAFREQPLSFQRHGDVDVKVHISDADAYAFAKTMASDQYDREERDYKVALHLVLSRLLAQAMVQREDFPALLTGVLENVPDYESLNLEPAVQNEIEERFARSNIPGPRGALANLSGGRFGLDRRRPDRSRLDRHRRYLRNTTSLCHSRFSCEGRRSLRAGSTTGAPSSAK